MADLDDFFAKKDKKKKSKKGFSKANTDILAKNLEENERREAKAEEKVAAVLATTEANKAQAASEGKLIEPDEEWHVYNDEKKDYSGLKIEALKIEEEEELEEDEEHEINEEGEKVRRQEAGRGPLEQDGRGQQRHRRARVHGPGEEGAGEGRAGGQYRGPQGKRGGRFLRPAPFARLQPDHHPNPSLQNGQQTEQGSSGLQQPGLLPCTVFVDAKSG